MKVRKVTFRETFNTKSDIKKTWFLQTGRINKL